jgi:hypothetical protein
MRYLAVGVVALALAASVFAQEDKDKPIRVRGVVKEVKADTATLVITPKTKEAEETISFVVKDDVPVKSGTDTLTLKALKAGDKVRVDYTVVEGKKVASKIRVENDEK